MLCTLSIKWCGPLPIKTIRWASDSQVPYHTENSPTYHDINFKDCDHRDDTGKPCVVFEFFSGNADVILNLKDSVVRYVNFYHAMCTNVKFKNKLRCLIRTLSI